MSAYQDMLAKDAFGYYGTLLNDVTYSPTMGKYLNAFHNVAPHLQRLGCDAGLHDQS